MTRAADLYAQARGQAEDLIAQEAADPNLDSASLSFLLHHDRRTPRAIVFLHGITSSPLQFRQLADLFHQHGFTVFGPRMPRHGSRDRLTANLARLTREELISYTNRAVDVGRGLGEHLTLAGLSVSGTLAAWAFQYRADVDLVVPIAPAFAPFGVPLEAIRPLTSVALRLPNVFLWWDPRVGARLRTPGGYPRFSTHAMAESFALGYEVYRAAATEAPRARELLTITNPNDRAVSTQATRAVLSRWRRYSNVRVEHREFATTLGHLHDVIGPYQPGARVEYVYPLLLDWIDRATGA